MDRAADFRAAIDEQLAGLEVCAAAGTAFCDGAQDSHSALRTLTQQWMVHQTDTLAALMERLAMEVSEALQPRPPPAARTRPASSPAHIARAVAIVPASAPTDRDDALRRPTTARRLSGEPSRVTFAHTVELARPASSPLRPLGQKQDVRDTSTSHASAAHAPQSWSPSRGKSERPINAWS